MANERPAAVAGWLTLVNDDLDGATQTVPETLTDGDLAHLAARGWRLTDPAVDAAASTPSAAAASGADAWVELVHPVTGGRQRVPNHPDAIAGQVEVGWVQPNRDGTVPKRALAKAAREQGVAVEELPSSQADADQDAAEEPAGDAGAEETDEADTSATTEEE